MELTVNGEKRDCPGPLSVGDLLASLGIEPTRVAVEVNLTVVPRSRLAEHALQDGDCVEIVSFVGGG
ncbi:MAG: sulfur carrier protein ThiS [Planctomycetes bacterium]|nr:sulfur carrier protein ThiS [Planctomycetota bacterium]